MAETDAQRKERRSRYEDGFRVLRGTREFVTYPEDASIRVWYSDVAWRYDMHLHSAVEIVVTLEGCVDYQVEDQVYHIRKNQVLIVPPNVSHALSMGENSKRLLFLFEPEPILEMRDIKKIQRSLEKVFFLQNDDETQHRIFDMLLKIYDCYQQREMMFNTLCFSDLLRIYALLSQQYLAGDFPQRQKESPVMDREVISSAMNYIDSHYQEDVSLEEVAAFTGFSRCYFSRSFKKQTGYSFRDYLSQRRIQGAMELLIHTDKPMNQVARESGFNSIATFNRTFREYKNCTPTQYRAIYGTF